MDKQLYRDVADRIAEDVRARRFQPGSWLKQIELQERYGCSRAEVRKALEKLAHRRMLQYIPNRGYYVYPEDSEKDFEILEIRILLETAAAERMITQARATMIDDLLSLAQHFDALISTGSIMAIYEANLAFHRALLASAGNRQLVELVDELRLRTSSAPASQWATRLRIEQSSREHFEMVDRLAARDAEGLRRVITAHIRQSSPN
ncbi:GntR family transcriptional regulator [Aurantimonas sp. MSK8Z-1]|uniref:GntR family transcriptional regulator n=1 Tax=Mangrovibrevibacter kandeliae TaxID=2968473 RepID=UPI002118A98A|nr:GntR family transcriptional regulator [Aurantimonas sp. MSK8Z-1]MCW4113352.1 GntR family transcriptional regulator [Aurantimonas sp. MSK8Z-1]